MSSIELLESLLSRKALYSLSLTFTLLLSPLFSLTTLKISGSEKSLPSDVDLYTDPTSNARRQANIWEISRPEDAAKMRYLANKPTAKWLVGGTKNQVFQKVKNHVSKANDLNKIPVLVAYQIPGRDCNSHSAGGATSQKAYRQWIQGFSEGIGNRKAIVIVEPDALAGMDCLDEEAKNIRLNLLKFAVQTLKRNNSNSYVYLDSGNPHWKDAKTMSVRLKNAGISFADGFSLNVSNFFTTEDNIKYGNELSALVGNKHFVIDTSRNGAGPTDDFQWCNPRERATGRPPTLDTSHLLVDAFLWIKVPGESDGNCNGGPNAGVWWPEYALELVTTRRELGNINSLKNVQIASFITPSEVSLGENVKLSLTFKNITRNVSNIIVDIEIYNSNNEKVMQKFFKNQSFNKDTSATYNLNWIADSPGRYTLKVGLFNNDWGENYYWNEKVLVFNVKPSQTASSLFEDKEIELWWPQNLSKLSGTQPLKAVIKDMDLSEYEMYWKVDDKQWRKMNNNYTDYPYKEVTVNLSSWDWSIDNIYTITFIAKKPKGESFATKHIKIVNVSN
jgi:endoglucanase